MAADERRAAILRAVRPVLLERGAAVTTRELARAAGVAEGTLFRVFDDKGSLVRAAVLAAVDPLSTVPDIEAIDRSLPLEDRLAELVRIGLARVGDSVRWMGVLHQLASLDPHEPRTAHAEQMREWSQRQEAGNVAVLAAAERLVRPDAERLRMPVGDVVELLNTVLLGAAMRQVDAARRGRESAPPDPTALVDLVLHGVLSRAPQDEHAGPAPNAPAGEGATSPSTPSSSTPSAPADTPLAARSS